MKSVFIYKLFLQLGILLVMSVRSRQLCDRCVCYSWVCCRCARYQCVRIKIVITIFVRDNVSQDAVHYQMLCCALTARSCDKVEMPAGINPKKNWKIR